jgi:hypothetical protein
MISILSFKRINKVWLVAFFVLLQLHCAFRLIAQPDLPPRQLTVNATQELHFGTFSLQSAGSSGGTVTVDWQGSRTSSGQIILLAEAPLHQAAVFEINLCQGRSVVITYSPSIVLIGSNGGSLTLNIGPTEKGPNGTSFQVNTDCSFITQLRVGGTLIIGSNGANPAGTYSGSFSITFNQQ